jgi:SNF2 family DNA or RNA helicase
MTKISQLLTGKIYGKPEIKAASVKKQKLASATALQILEHLPKRKMPNTWEKYKFLRGVLLADEVGSGKTFETLSIVSYNLLNAAKNSRKRFRVLIIAAPAIRSKWEWKEETDKETCCDLKRFVQQTYLSNSKKELLERFFKTAQGNNIITSKNSWKEVSKLRQGIWITSFGALPATKGSRTKAIFKRDRSIKFPTEFFDYIIADEAHIVKSGYNDTDSIILPSLNNSAIRKIYAVQNESRNPKLLLLTATPFQNNLQEFIHMLSLVESPNNMHYSVIKIIDSGLKKLNEEIELLRKGEGVSNDKIDELVYSFDSEVARLIGETNGDLGRPGEIRTFGRRNGLDDFLRDVMIRNNKMPLDILSTECVLGEAEKLQYLFMRDIASSRTEDERDMMFSVRLSQLVSSDEAFTSSLRKPNQKSKYACVKKLFENKNLIFEKKANALEDVIANKVFADNKHVVVVFCRFIATIKALEVRLGKKYSDSNVVRMDGKTKAKDRRKLLDEIETRNQEGKSPIIFLVSQVGNEGLDFDKFSDTVIHFDGHYNPAVIDQRNGRVYRRKNVSSQITIKHIYLKDTYDQRIKFIEAEKRKMKNFFLGDASLEAIVTGILQERDIQKEKMQLQELAKIKFDFEPKEKYLIPGEKKRLL